MTRDELNTCISMMIGTPMDRGNLPPFDPNFLANSLVNELTKHWDDLPEATRITVLGVAASLRQHFEGALFSTIHADMAVSKARGVQPAITLVDHVFTVEVTHLVDDGGGWLAECDALHLVTEAETYDAVVARALEIAPELAVENGMADTSHRVALDFVHRQGSLISP